MTAYLKKHIREACFDDTERDARVHFANMAAERNWAVQHKTFNSGVKQRPTIVFTFFLSETKSVPEAAFGLDGDVYTQVSRAPGNSIFWVKLGGTWVISQPFKSGRAQQNQWHPIANRRVFVRESHTWLSPKTINRWASDSANSAGKDGGEGAGDAGEGVGTSSNA